MRFFGRSKKEQPNTIVIRNAGQMSVYWEQSLVIDTRKAKVVHLMVSFVKGDSAGCEICWTISPNGDNWYRSNDDRKLYDSISTCIDIPVSQYNGSFMRILYVAIGQSTNTSLSILASLETLKGE